MHKVLAKLKRKYLFKESSNVSQMIGNTSYTGTFIVRYYKKETKKGNKRKKPHWRTPKLSRKPVR